MAGVTNIATMLIDRSDAAALFFSRDALKARGKDPDSPLTRVSAWIRAQDSRVVGAVPKVGGPDDDYAFLYYYESVRYKVDKAGRAFVSSADADDMMESTERDLQLLIDTILDDELVRALTAVLPQVKAKRGKAKHQDDADGIHSKTIMGIMR